MFAKNVLLSCTLAVLLALVLTATALVAGERAKPAADRPPGPQKPVAAPAAEPAGPAHALLTDIKAVGAPVVSRDGRWLAVREGADQLVLLDLAAALDAPDKAERKRYPIAPLVKRSQFDTRGWGRAAAFSEDSAQMLLRGPQGLQVLALPPKAEPRKLGLGADGIPFLEGRKIGGYVHWLVLEAAEQVGDVAGEDRALLRRLERVLDTTDPTGPEPKRPLIRPDTAFWAPDGKSLFATLESDALGRIDARTGEPTPLVTRQQVEAKLGQDKPVDFVSAEAAGPDGRVLIHALRKGPDMSQMMGTYVAGGDEAPERGRNPGSAEPGPGMPSYVYLWDGKDLTLIRKLSLARWIDTLLVAPSEKLDRFLAFQVANLGGAGSGTPQAWLGSIDARGKLSERECTENLKGLEAPGFSLLAVRADGSRALAVMTGQQTKEIKLKGKTEQERAMEMMMLAMQSGRPGGSMSKDGAIFKFGTCSLWILDAEKQEARQVGPSFGEAKGGLEGVVGIPGVPQREDIVWSPAGGVAAMSLQSLQFSPGKLESGSNGLLLVRPGTW
ncbi:MAG: hypothetical protein M5U26_09220 [Planctomycetota bacterium]|nr:hypothetical protein [Planctomycetota bacterium]